MLILKIIGFIVLIVFIAGFIYGFIEYFGSFVESDFDNSGEW